MRIEFKLCQFVFFNKALGFKLLIFKFPFDGTKRKHGGLVIREFEQAPQKTGYVVECRPRSLFNLADKLVREIGVGTAEIENKVYILAHDYPLGGFEI